MRKLVSLFICIVAISVVYAQQIDMNFPALAGEQYGFVIFQGDKAIEVVKGDTIPADGVFTISIPKEQTPYRGLANWYVLDKAKNINLMLTIPGSGYTVRCPLSLPVVPENITFQGYAPFTETDSLYGKQIKLIEKFRVINAAMELYGKDDKLYKVFDKEKKQLSRSYENLQHYIHNEAESYATRFLPIMSVSKGIPPLKLSVNQEEIYQQMIKYINTTLNFDDLYTSGYWDDILGKWLMTHLNIIQDDAKLVRDFTEIGERIGTPEKYTNFVATITKHLNSYGKDKQIEILAPNIIESGKITEYKGTLSVYNKGRIGSKAPDLILRQYIGKEAGKKDNKKISQNYINTKLEGKNIVNEGDKAFIIFYESNCGHCSQFLDELSEKYEKFKAENIEIITISADTDEEVFYTTAEKFPWKQNFCDFKGIEGVNFQNYAVQGTPTIYLINKQGTIEARMATLEDMIKAF